MGSGGAGWRSTPSMADIETLGAEAYRRYRTANLASLTVLVMHDSRSAALKVDHGAKKTRSILVG